MGVYKFRGYMFFMGEVYFSGGENFRSEKGFYDLKYFLFDDYLICPICKQKFDPRQLGWRVTRVEYNDGSMKKVNMCSCPWGHEINVGTDIRAYKCIDYGYME
jgi:hypothetical protein